MTTADAATLGLFAPADEGSWLFGRRTDLLAFGGSALLSFLLLAAGAAFGWLHADTPDWAWLACVLSVDVAHVWSTGFRVYLDPKEIASRPLLYFGVPVMCYALGVFAHAASPATFWRALAYVAVFHFVRQQYGWVVLYRRRAGETGRLDRVLDTGAIYAATVYPLVWWHAHLPRSFHWFLAGDFVRGVSTSVATALAPVYWAVLAAFAARQLWLLSAGRPVNQGKVLVVATTWACWWVGIVVLDSDYAFTVTNVLIHGLPYMVLTYRYGRARATREPAGALARLLRAGAAGFVAFVLVAAFAEEGLWDRYVWHDRPWLFGSGHLVGAAMLTLLVPLLALPQMTHYALDGFLWTGKQLRRARAI